MLSIRTNVAALVAAQNLQRNQSALQTSMLRLSTGLRINSAADDPAGSAIANRMTAQINGMGQAQRNTNDGISLVQVAEGALNGINDNLQRIRQLAVRAANGTWNQADLDSMQDEIGQRLAEIDRLSAQTDFNGVHVLDRDQNVRIQVGANDGDTINIPLQRINTASLDLQQFNVNGGDPASAHNVLEAMHEGGTVITHAGGADTTWTRLVDGRYTSDVSAPDAGNTVDVDALRARIRQSSADVAVDTGAGYHYVVAVADGSVSEGGTPVLISRDGKLFATADSVRSRGPLKMLDDAMSKVDRLRSRLGATQNRFESVIDGLGTSIINLSASRSRIQDADYAREVSNMIRAQIRQQIGVAMLAQANRVPSMILTLLRQSMG